MMHWEIFTMTHMWERELKQIISPPGKWTLTENCNRELGKAASSGI